MGLRDRLLAWYTHGPGFKHKINKTVRIIYTVSKTIVLERTQEICTIR